MTEPIQQNVEKEGRGTAEGSKQTQFKRGYDPRRWLNGRGKKSPEQKEGEKILLAVIWEELSREYDKTGKALEAPETVDAFRLMVRSWIKKHPEMIADRIAGKVPQRVEGPGEGGAFPIEGKIDDERFNRAISSLADAIREGVSGKGNKPDGKVDTSE